MTPQEEAREKLLQARYYLPGEDWDGFCCRVAAFVTQGMNDDDFRQRVFYALVHRRIIFNSPILMNAGTANPQASACFVWQPEDNMDSIMDLQTVAAKIFKQGSGIGVDYSKLRPEGAELSTRGTSSGAVSFMSLVDHLADVIKAGSTRRAAVLASLRIDHPDIFKFIKIKRNDDMLLNTNISVMVTNEFMQHVANEEFDTPWPLVFDGKVYQTTTVGELWKELVHNAWLRGDPGVVFIDTVNSTTPGVDGKTYAATNACAELPLYHGEACLIGSINLAQLAYEDGVHTDRLKECVTLLTRCLNNVIDYAQYPDPRIEAEVKKYRRIAIGVTGFGDMLIKLHRSYGDILGPSSSLRQQVEEIIMCITNTANKISGEMAKACMAQNKFPDGFDMRVFEKHHRLNLATTVVAPTGATSIIVGAECSGIEPLYAIAYTRHIREGNSKDTTEYHVVSELFRNVFKTRMQRDLTDEEIKEIVEAGGSVQKLTWVPSELRQRFMVASDLSPEAHVRMQAIVQSAVNNAVSKTVNLPNAATEEDVAKVYLMAYQEGCKGTTVFRDGCKNTQVLVTGKKEDSKPVPAVSEFPAKLPEMMEARRIRLPMPDGSHLYVLVSFLNGKPMEVFANLGRSGQDVYAYTEALGRLASLALRHGVEVKALIKTLKGIRGRDVGLFGDQYIYSVPDALAIALDVTQNGYEGKTQEEVMQERLAQKVCPECGEPIRYDGSCSSGSCTCGWSRCS